MRRPGPWLAILLLTLAVPARRRMLMDNDGRTAPVSWASLLLRELPFVARRAWTSRRVRRQVADHLARSGRRAELAVSSPS